MVIFQTSEEEFQALYESHGRKIKRTLEGMTGSEAVAQELTHEAFLKAWAQLPSFMRKSKLSTWLYQIAINTGRDYLRAHRRAPAVEEEYVELLSPERRAVREGLLEIKSEEREILVLHYYEGQSIEEISEILSAPQGTVKSRLFEARKDLRERLLKKGFDV
jgi:RNA polymerase sigma-70 factor (ECF subfamily)